ncbi:O-methyltransferase [Parasphingorhabdus sp.]|uniref:O-methyltransferase n=1 Tax=Parasphingorhabdus sp. TaxID=2709688 RepID=UPI003002500A
MQSADPSWSDVDDYIVNHLIGEDPALDACLAANAAAGLPPIDVSITQGRMLELLARANRAENILEIGTLGGFSAISLARGLGHSGKLVTLELEPDYAAVARRNLDNAGQGEKVDILVGEALATLHGLVEQRRAPFDLVFVDADKQNYASYLDYALKLARPGALLIFDNVVREGRVLDPSSDDPKVPGTRKLYEMLKNHPQLDATAIQTVGAKKWDGFLMAVVREE